LARPSQKRIPMLRLARAQRRRALGAVEHEIRGQIFADFRRDLILRCDDPVDDGIGKPRQWHFGRLDIFMLRRPFVGERAGKFRHGRGKHAAARRANGFAIETDPVDGLLPLVELACGNGNRLVETRPQRRPHRAARRFDRIVALMTFEEFPHLLRFTRSFKHLLGQNRPYTSRRASPLLALSPSDPSARQWRFFLKMGTTKTFYTQYKTTKTPPPPTTLPTPLSAPPPPR